MIVLGWILFAFGLARLVVSFVNWVDKPYLPRSRTECAAPPEVSVLIPARNEERRIGCLLEDLAAERTGIREIIVYDDRSTDATAAVVRRCARADRRVQLIAGGELPAGWQGKNHACYRLAQQAAGRCLLFLDADVRIRGQAVVRALRYVGLTGVDLLSLFPRQRMPAPGTRLTVPLMNWILLSLLPLAAVRRSPQEALCAANGQFLFFDAAVYRTLQPHRTLRRSAVEDMAVARYYKRCGRHIAVLLGDDDVACTMYEGLRDSVGGLSRSVFSFFGGSETVCYLFLSATTAAPFVVFAGLGVFAGLLYLLTIILIRVFVSSASRQSVASNLLLMIPQQFLLGWIVLTASDHKRRRRQLWKGRNIYRVG